MRTPNPTLNERARRIASDGLAARLRRLDIKLDDDLAAVRAKIMRLRTDASAWIEPRDSLVADAIALYLALADPDERAETMGAYTRGAIGNLDLKHRITDTIASALQRPG